MSDQSNPSRLIHPAKLARKCATLSGGYAVAELERLSGIVSNDTGQMQYQLRFDVDEQNRFLLDGTIDGSLYMTCERCLGEVLVPVNSHFVQAVVLNEAQAEKLPGHLDPLLVDDSGQVSLKELIEEEILLSLPIVAKHIEDVCPVRTLQALEKREKRNNPFDALGTLKPDA